MSRKWTTLVVMSAAAILFSGLSWAADDESPLAKIMEKVQANNIVITKGTRTSIAYKKAQKDVSEAAAQLAELGKEARSEKGPSEAQKKPHAEWEKLMDDFIAKSDELAKLTAKSGTEQAAAKKSFNAVKVTCTNCHNVYRVDE
ncbi:MAG: cytochrome c [Isosphaeraceae bacterium]